MYRLPVLAFIQSQSPSFCGRFVFHSSCNAVVSEESALNNKMLLISIQVGPELSQERGFTVEAYLSNKDF